MLWLTDGISVVQLPKTTQVFFEIQSGRPVPRLCEPRHLYGVSGHVSQTLSRWPKECEVIQEEIHHIGEKINSQFSISKEKFGLIQPICLLLKLTELYCW